MTCDEWKIAHHTAKAEELPAGGHYGRTSLPPPACKLSVTGAQRWAKTNKHLMELRAATLEKGNKTTVVTTVKGIIEDAVKTKPEDAVALAKDVAAQVKNKTAALVAELKE